MNIGLDDEELGFNHDKFNLALSYQFNETLGVGLNTKYITVSTGLDRENIDEASGFGWDVGVLFKPRLMPRFSVGLTLQDIAGNHTDGFWGISNHHWYAQKNKESRVVILREFLPDANAETVTCRILEAAKPIEIPSASIQWKREEEKWHRLTKDRRALMGHPVAASA